MCDKIPCRCSCDGRRVDDVTYSDPAGSFAIRAAVSEEVRHDRFRVRLPCFALIGLAIARDQDEANALSKALDEPVWVWDGDPDLPTLSPSIRTFTSLDGKSVEQWHGYVRRGRAASC